MTLIQTPGQVWEAIQKAKAGAKAFCTNYFPVESKLKAWIDHGELSAEWHDGAAFFFRTDRDFQHFYFCAADTTSLEQGMTSSPGLKASRLSADLVGDEALVNRLLPVLERAGFRKFIRLQRMARIGCPKGKSEVPEAVFAESADSPAVLSLIESLFSRYGEQLPLPYEMESAVAGRQVLVVKPDNEMAGVLFFETQGFASTIRFWAVAEKFRARRVGSALMQSYFQTQARARRFTLWVDAHNENAIQKYGHYGYAADGLIDHVLVNEMITL